MEVAEPKVRLFFRIGYLGDAFHGSQVQPDVKTVQGELIRVFRALKWLRGPEEDQVLVLSSRTDAGVHVRINGGIVDLDASLWQALTPRKMIRAIDDRLDDNIAFLTVEEVESDHNPRMALHRVYRYRLECMEFWQAPALEEFKTWLNLFVGTYDARNFARLEEGKNPIRTVLDVQPWMDGDRIMGFEIKGEAFLWNQVRRTANALFRLAVGELQPDDVKTAIDHPLQPVDFGVAPPEWLVLWGVAWEGAPLPPSTHSTSFSPPPVGRTAERTRKARWQRAAQHELKSMLHNEWATIGILPITRHRTS
jgi:tRNA pseudouridine38-40 synthase